MILSGQVVSASTHIAGEEQWIARDTALATTMDEEFQCMLVLFPVVRSRDYCVSPLLLLTAPYPICFPQHEDRSVCLCCLCWRACMVALDWGMRGRRIIPLV
jgi:hypothetical protein